MIMNGVPKWTRALYYFQYVFIWSPYSTDHKKDWSAAIVGAHNDMLNGSEQQEQEQQ